MHTSSYARRRLHLELLFNLCSRSPPPFICTNSSMFHFIICTALQADNLQYVVSCAIGHITLCLLYKDVFATVPTLLCLNTKPKIDPGHKRLFCLVLSRRKKSICVSRDFPGSKLCCFKQQLLLLKMYPVLIISLLTNRVIHSHLPAAHSRLAETQKVASLSN